MEAITASNNISKTGQAKENDVTIQVWDLRKTTYSDQTGAFPLQSYHGNHYVMVLVEINLSGILVEPLKYRYAKELKGGYTHLIQRLRAAGVRPKKHVMDNKVSEMMRDTIEKE